MSRNVLKNSAGETVYVDEGESALLTATLYDTQNQSLDKASITSLTMTLTNSQSGSTVIINSRDNQNILDANGGSVATDGTLTLKLLPDDNKSCVGSAESVVRNYLTLKWSWVDVDSVVQTGKQQFEIWLLPTAR